MAKYTEDDLREDLKTKEYEAGFYTDIEYEDFPVGLNEEIVRMISAKKEVTRDTTKIYYADKYPTNFVTDYSFMNATYQANGMFDVYTEGFFGQGYYSERISTYKKDPTYLLVHTYETNDTSAYSGNLHSLTTYTYNESKDIVLESQISDNSYYKTEYYDYVYDAKGNWTSRKSHSQNNSEVWENDRVETRTITYFE
jgi:hypothetical protein